MYMMYRLIEISCTVCFALFLFNRIPLSKFQVFIYYSSLVYYSDSVLKIVRFCPAFDLLSFSLENIDKFFLYSLIYPINTHWSPTMSGIVLGAPKVVRFSGVVFLQ